ncbi:MAG: hypothetical protein P1U56_02855 [Saprospiraceae bacterium]|nr:hypothetical protein [Saprospiraceae bacterium]
MENTAKKTKIIYEGDVYAGSFYLFIGVCGVLTAASFYFFTERLGFFYLSIGLSIFSIYMLGKGAVMIYLYFSRYRFYKNHDQLSREEIKDERRYTRWRVLKKKKNRRRYIYTILFGCLIAFMGIFHREKGLIGATCIPIVLMAMIEFGVGLLTEFRLTEYLKHLHKLSELFNIKIKD